MMENEEVKLLSVIGAVSRCAGAGLGRVAAAGGKVTGAVKSLFTRPFDEFALVTDEQDEATPQTPLLKLEIENTAPRGDELVSIVTALESDVAEVRSQLAEAQNRIEDMQSQFASQLSELQSQKDSLIFDLEQTTKEVNHLRSTEAMLRARMTAMESELDTTKTELEKARRPERFAKPQLLSEVSIAQTEPEVLLSEQQQDETVVSVEEKVEPFREITTAENKNEAEIAIEESPSQPQVADFDIPVSEIVGITETEQSELPEQEQKEPAVVQTEQKVESSIETTAVQSDGQEQVQAEVEEFQPVFAETSNSVPADVAIEEVNAADFDSTAEKIIFIRALSDIASQDKAMRVDAVKVMASIRHELSVRALVAQMACEPSVLVRQECIKALTGLEMKEGACAVERALADEAASVRLAAVWGLYRLAGTESISALMHMLSDRDTSVRRRAITCIGWLGKEEVAVELLPLLEDNSVSVRQAVVEAMGNLHCQQAIPSLIERLNDPDETTRKVILNALETITGKKMNGPCPRDEKSSLRLVARWQQWWKDESKVLY
jgi:outer membrane murein-binding lipoprotein Lpp